MKVATAEQMRAIDRRANEEYGIPGIVLMEAAGAALARVGVEELGGDARNKCVVVFCGKGNNGGDGFVAARYLANAGAEVFVLLTGGPSELKGDAARHYAPLRKMPIHHFDAVEPDFLAALYRADLLVDALLGTGVRGPIDPHSPMGKRLLLLSEIHLAGKTRILSADVPSGLDADTGRAAEGTVHASRTVTFALPKPGLLTYPGASYAGRITVAEIGIPEALLTSPDLNDQLTTADEMRRLLPPRAQARDANKGSFGTLLVIAGSPGMAGAACFTAISALRAGAGLVVLAVPESMLDTAAALAPEAVLKGLPETPERTHGGLGALEAALALAETADAVALGPGMAGTEKVVSFVQQFSSTAAKPLVVDADGLNALAKAGPQRVAARRSEAPFVVTPHPGEMGRLMACGTKQVQEERLSMVRECATRYGVTALLKGARTLIAATDGRLAFNRGGSVVLATAGSGDVLTGVIGALLASGLDGFDAARAGAYLHALSGEWCERQIGTAGVLATEIRDSIPQARRLLTTNDPVLDPL
ncbi:MAG: NAD(P)H-hydrate dehydratase [Cytophagales bacterium]|nr:NAD(P)H-hydrate dehydratase [Armatimonadota bacterium]